jgi:hypothetical protein
MKKIFLFLSISIFSTGLVQAGGFKRVAAVDDMSLLCSEPEGLRRSAAVSDMSLLDSEDHGLDMPRIFCTLLLLKATSESQFKNFVRNFDSKGQTILEFLLPDQEHELFPSIVRLVLGAFSLEEKGRYLSYYVRELPDTLTA